MHLNELLAQKGFNVHCLPAETSVENALRLMDEKQASAVIITQGDVPLGIFTERDIMRCHVAHSSRSIATISVQEVMTNKLIVAEAHEKIGDALSMMIQIDISHLPVAKDGKIVGLLSFRDIAQQHFHSLVAELEHLQDYIADLHEACKD